MNDLVSKASTAYINAYGKTLMTFDERHLEAMTAAAKVLLEAALGEPSMAEIAMHDKANGYQPSRLKWSDINWYLAYRRARLLAPKTIDDQILEAITNWQYGKSDGRRETLAKAIADIVRGK